MRGPKTRSRSLALVLLLVCAGAFAHEVPPIPVGSTGEASLVLQVGTPAAAFPASSWTVAIDGGRNLSTGPARPFRGMRSSATPQASTRERRPREHVPPPSSFGSALLGLLVAPANAPPRA